MFPVQPVAVLCDYAALLQAYMTGVTRDQARKARHSAYQELLACKLCYTHRQ